VQRNRSANIIKNRKIRRTNMRKSKLVLPIISFLLAVILAVLVILPVNMYAVKEVPGTEFGFFGFFYCFCGAGTTCVCVMPEEPGG
jgi:uncharacterized membrane protein YdjX (TVP38/TMEM64 family)